jgi:predicted signal transduction protein with EAL and GGDEF domain/DNA-binding NarL/FixJ family response regulator
MDEDKIYSVIVIDDNPEIHQDFVKILQIDTAAEVLASSEEALFGDSLQADKAEEKVKLPKVKIDSAYQGEEGLALIQRKVQAGENYVIAFVDIRMPPGLDGIKTISKIWDVDPDMQIVICSAYSDYTWQEIANILGESEKLLVLKKPFDVIEARQIVSSLVRKWEVAKEMSSRVSNLTNIVAEKSNELEKYLSLISTTLESSSDGIIILDNQGFIVDFNNRFVNMWELPVEMIKSEDNNTIFKFIVNKTKSPDKAKTLFEESKTKPESELIQPIELLNGQTFEFYSRPHTLGNKVIGWVWSFRNITEKIELQVRLTYQATHDQLTGLANRYLLLDRLQLAMDLAKRTNSLCAVFFMDIDKFKIINDSLGHEVGDQILMEFSHRLKHSVRKVDLVARAENETNKGVKDTPKDDEHDQTIARMGGDEFIIVLGDIKTKPNCFTIYTRIKEAMALPFIIGDHKFDISCSVGVSVYPDNGETVTELLKNADIAMYRVKRSGGDNFQFYSEQMNVDALKRMQIETELKRAIQNNEFILEYQPEIDLQTGKIVSFEALIRWRHPRLGLVPPLEFIPIAEDIGFISSIGQWVLNAAAKQSKLWRDKGWPYTISINISAQEFRQTDLIKQISSAIKDAGIPGDAIELEITESLVIENFDFVLDKMKQLKGLGIKFAIDDFGTGYSSLNYLSRIPVDKIKIDRSFICTITEDMNAKQNQDHVIIQTIIAFARELNVPVLAEGIENVFQKEFLTKHECSLGQGYYFSRPMPAEQVEKLLTEKLPQ